MSTFGYAIRTGLGVYLGLGAIAYSLWYVSSLPFWWLPAVVLPPLFLIPLGKRRMLAKRPINPTGVGWKLSFQWVFLFLSLDLFAVWLYDSSFRLFSDLLTLAVGITVLGRYILVLISGPIAAERFRKALRKSLGFFRG